MSAASAAGCTSQHHVVGGPVVAYPDGRPSYGSVVAVGEGLGPATAKGEGFHTMGFAGRALLTPDTLQLRGGVALQRGDWSGPGRFFFEGTVPAAIGIERSQARTDGSIGSGLALRIGYPLTDHTSYSAPLFLPAHRVPERQMRRRRERTILVAGPSADIDFRFSSAPLPTLSFLIGILWLSQALAPEEPSPPLRWRPFGVR